jgi:hypothetical protein
MLKLGHTPRHPGAYLLMARTDQQQIRQHRDAKRLLDPSLLPTDLMLAQPEVGLQLAVDLWTVLREGRGDYFSYDSEAIGETAA